MSKAHAPTRNPGRHLFATIVGILILLFPAAALVVPRGGNTVVFLIVACGAAALFAMRKCPRGRPDIPAGPYFNVFVASLCLPIIAIVFVELLHRDVVANTLDSPARFLLAVLVFLGLRHIASIIPRWIDLTFGLGAISAAFMALYSTAETLAPRAESTFLNPIHFGDIALLLGVLSVVSIHWLARDRFWLVIFKLIGGAAGCYASWASQSRGGWVALPVLLVIWLLCRPHSANLKRRAVIAGVAVVLVASSFLSSTVRDRFNNIHSDLASLSAGQADTSIGIRLELWKTAVKLIRENPWTGLGAHGYRNAMPAMAAAGDLTPMAADYGKGEVHNQILAYFADYGLLGLLAILGVYLGPAYFFIRVGALQPRRREQRAALMGLMTAVSFAVFGLTVETFNLKVTVAFYATMLALLAALAYPDSPRDTAVAAERS
ncbi:O-antigen ligase family protein [Pandoraea sp. PE-S2T-3]|uniref:O-antigen ligase family protein n=1 Tax=Pandoraea sp. PE-S2T-3 TaxID=1986993 RepID=UPI000B3F8F87|nr:O-antigen ligase family protein [Pandoraea sp. PE-S2T-3]